jgi:PAS domain S-box-containing protein
MSLKPPHSHSINENNLSRLVDTNVVGIAFWTIDGKITDANDLFLRMFGYKREEMRDGHLCWELLIREDQHCSDQEMGASVQQFVTAIAPIESEYLRKDNSRIPVLVSGAFLDEAQSEGVALVLDLSEHKTLEQRKDTFINMASHELKTPLTTLKGSIQLLERKLSRQGLTEHLAALSRIERQVNRLNQLVSAMLDVSQIQAGKLEYARELIAIDDLLRDVVGAIQQTTKRHTILLHGSTGKEIEGDHEHIEQVFLNLLGNALKYSPEANIVDVYLGIEKEQVIVCVRDYGVGIPEEEQQHIFERFYRSREDKKQGFSGLGIGLHIAQEIVERHCGTITVESEEGKGTAFKVKLPLHR